jgi:hypothetical protein
MNKITLGFFLAKRKTIIKGLLLLFAFLLMNTQASWGQTSFTATLGSFVNATKAYALSYSPITPAYVSSPIIFGNSGLTSDTTMSSVYASYTGWDVQSRYFYYSITADSGYNLTITAINSNLRSSGTGPRALAVETATSLVGTWTQCALSSFTSTANGDVNASSLSITVNAGQTLYIRYRNTSTVSANGSTVATGGTGRINSGSIVGTYVSAGLTTPTLTPAPANVDAPFDVTFTDDVASQAWVLADGTSITVGGTVLTAGYTITNGKITFTPSASVPAGLLQTVGVSKAIVISKTGYSNATVSQTINAGVPTSNSTATISAALASNTTRTITCTAKDQYNNLDYRCFYSNCISE